jgi:hypothetical protein
MKYTFKKYCDLLDALKEFNGADNISRDTWLINIFENMYSDEYGIFRESIHSSNRQWYFQKFGDKIYYSAIHVEIKLEEEFKMKRKDVIPYLTYMLKMWGFKVNKLERKTLPYFY